MAGAMPRAGAGGVASLKPEFQTRKVTAEAGGRPGPGLGRLPAARPL